MDVILFVIFVAVISWVTWAALNYLFKSGTFKQRALFFAKILCNNQNNTKNNLSFKDIFFLSLEDYLNYYYKLNLTRKKSITNYIFEHFDDIISAQEDIRTLTKEILIGHFMYKKTHASGNAWVLVSKYTQANLDDMASSAVSEAYSKYPFKIPTPHPHSKAC